MANEFETAACVAFYELHPECEKTPGNELILGTEAFRLLQEGYNLKSVGTWELAFQNRRSEFKLTPSVHEQPLSETMEYHSVKYFHGLSDESREVLAQRLVKLTPGERDGLPDHLARFLLNYEHKQRTAKPELSEEAQSFAEVCKENKLATSDKNYKILSGWLQKRSLDGLASNWNLAIEACSEHLDLSAEKLDQMSAKDYRAKFVEPAFKKRQAELAAQPKHERGNPPGFSYVSWLHNQ